jgi:hypothetical protein
VFGVKGYVRLLLLEWQERETELGFVGYVCGLIALGVILCLISENSIKLMVKLSPRVI